METGKLILVGGFSGGGKSTLIEAALTNVDNVKYLRTTTTRPLRPGEAEHGFEYDHVSWEEYNAAQKDAGENWDGVVYDGHGYGADVGRINRTLAGGTNIIGGTVPDLDAIDQAERLYVAKPVLVWVDTSFQTASERLWKTGDKRRMKRVWHNLEAVDQVERIRQLASVVLFKPGGDLETDKVGFVDVIRCIVRGANQAR